MQNNLDKLKPLNEYIKESILSSTGTGANSIIMGNIIKYLKDIKDGGNLHGGKGPEVIDLYIPGTSRQTRLDGVFKFWFPRSKHNSKIAQFYKKVMVKSGYKDEYEATGDLTLTYEFELSKVQDRIFYGTLEQKQDTFWENRIFKIGEVYMIFSFIKDQKSATTTLYVYALNPDMTISQNLTNEIKKALS
jgi:hypothetical protein